MAGWERLCVKYPGPFGRYGSFYLPDVLSPLGKHPCLGTYLAFHMSPGEYLQHIISFLSSLPINPDLPSGIALGLSRYYSSRYASMEMLRWSFAPLNRLSHTISFSSTLQHTASVTFTDSLAGKEQLIGATPRTKAPQLCFPLTAISRPSISLQRWLMTDSRRRQAGRRFLRNAFSTYLCRDSCRQKQRSSIAARSLLLDR